MRIDWKIIDHNKQRYLTSGDWFWTREEGEHVLNVRISRMSDHRYELCLGVHEVVEAILCWHAAIAQEDVDAFDIGVEDAHAAGATHYPCGCARRELSDPGSDKHAPYHKQCMLANGIERVVAFALGIHWHSYDEQVDRPSP